MSNSNINSENTFDNFITAVSLLYHSTSTETKKKADEFLYKFDKSNEAWDISMQVLSTPNLEEEAYFNASQVIKKKMRFDFANFSTNTKLIQTLSDFLIQRLIDFKDHKLYLLSNLCKCFSILCLFSHSSEPSPLQKLIQTLTFSDNIKNKMSILLVLSYTAENDYDSDIVIDLSIKKSFTLYLQNISDYVISYLNSLIDYINRNKDNFIKSDATNLSFFRLMNKNVINNI